MVPAPPHCEARWPPALASNAARSIFGLHVSRLTRNYRDWHQLLEPDFLFWAKPCTSSHSYPTGVKRVLLTGMSGTGKSTVITELAARGYKAIDTEDGNWHAWVNVNGEPDWVWREDRIRDLLSTEDADVLFVSGTSSNQGKFYRQFDHVVLLSAPRSVIIERLASRTNNPYGKYPDEVARVLGHIATVEPLLRRRATLEVDTTAPLDQVVETILRLVRP